MAISTRSGRVLGPVEETRAEESDDGDESLPKPIVTYKSIVINVDLDKTEKHPIAYKEDVCEKEKEKKTSKVMSQMLKPPPPFPQRLKKKAEDDKFCRFISMLK